MNGFKKNDEKFPENWTLNDYEKYVEECDRILEKCEENEEKTFQSNRRNSQVF